MSNAENGARIKAFAGPNVGSGIVKNITFSHFKETNVDNPLIIDQVSRINFMSKVLFLNEPESKCYETSSANCAAFPSNVYIQDVVFNECAILLHCFSTLTKSSYIVSSAAYRAFRLETRNLSWRHLIAHLVVDAAISVSMT